MWLGGLQCHSSPAGSERRSKPLGIWMAAAPIVFKTKWPQAPGSGPDYGFGRVHVLRKDKSPSPHPWVYLTLFQRFTVADVSLQTFPQLLCPLLGSSPDRNWLPRWFTEIIPKIITFCCLWRRDMRKPVLDTYRMCLLCSELAVSWSYMKVLAFFDLRWTRPLDYSFVPFSPRSNRDDWNWE